MSLTDFVQSPPVRALFNKTATGIPKGHFSSSILVDSVDKTRASLVGTAVDYMIRTLLARQAEKIEIPYYYDGYAAWIAIAKAKASGDQNLASRLSEVSGRCEHIFDGIIDGGDIEAFSFVEACYRMAKMDVVGRVGFQYVDGVFCALTTSHPDQSVLTELLCFLDLLDVEKAFSPKKVVILNPTFQHSLSVGGADADLCCDDTIFDFKTTIQNTLHRHHFEQIAGYAALSEIGGFSCLVDGKRQIISGVPIKNLGLFFPRQNLKLVYPMAELFGIFGWEEYVSGFKALLNIEPGVAA